MCKQIIINFLAISCCLLFAQSCERKQQGTIELTRDLRIQIDTTANRQINQIAQQYDSLCRLKTANLTRQFTDSLVQVRKQLIQQKMAQ